MLVFLPPKQAADEIAKRARAKLGPVMMNLVEPTLRDLIATELYGKNLVVCRVEPGDFADTMNAKFREEKTLNLAPTIRRN